MAVTLVDDIVGEWVRKAEASGEVKLLPGYGKPLNLDDDKDIPSEYRLISRVLKNANILPPEVHFLRTIHTLKTQLEDENDPQVKDSLRSNLRQQQLKLAIALEKLNKNA